jgi:antitoxin (DNA-binding transcriptional repressor) of toxin-antitoxin stability system
MQPFKVTRVSLSEFRRRLSHWIAEAEAGRKIEVVRRGRAAVQVEGVRFVGLHVGSRFGKGGIRPLRKGYKSRGILKTLAEDRRQDR